MFGGLIARPDLSLGLVFLAVAGIVGCEAASTNSLIGTWSLVSVSATAADGTVDPAPYGPQPTGYLTYTADGYMQVIVALSSRPRLSSDWRASPPDERAAAFATSLSYAGRFSVSGGQVTHHIEASSDPNRVGTSIVRTISWRDGQLALRTPPTQVGGSAREFALIWQRVGEQRTQQ